MASIQVHDVTQPWSLPVGVSTAGSPGPAAGVGAVLLLADGVSTGVEATLSLPAAADLTAYDELRFWARADRRADGTAGAPVLVEVGFDDAADLPGDDHHWLVPVRAGRWEHHRLGIGAERRSAVTRLRVRWLTGERLRLELAEVLAVRDEPMTDVETSLVDRLTSSVRARVPAAVTALPAAAGASQLVVGLSPALRARHRVAVVPASAPAGDPGSSHDVAVVVHDTVLGRTTLTLSDGLPTVVPAGSAVTVQVPVLVGPPTGGTAPDPCLHLTLTDFREDLARGWQVPQRDSLRRRPTGTTCCLRPAPRPVVLEYQVLVEAMEPAAAGALRGDVLACLGTQVPLRVDGVELPVATVPAPVRTERTRDVLTPVVVQIGTRLETGPRVETARPTSVGVVVGPFDSRDDTERIVVRS